MFFPSYKLQINFSLPCAAFLTFLLLNFCITESVFHKLDYYHHCLFFLVKKQLFYLRFRRTFMFFPSVPCSTHLTSEDTGGVEYVFVTGWFIESSECQGNMLKQTWTSHFATLSKMKEFSGGLETGGRKGGLQEKSEGPVWQFKSGSKTNV